MGTYTPNIKGIRAYLKTSPELQKELHRRAIMGLAAARALAPKGESGKLAQSGEVQFDGTDGGVNGDRMQFSIHFTVSYAVPVTYPRGDKDAREYLLAAIPVIEAG